MKRRLKISTILLGLVSTFCVTNSAMAQSATRYVPTRPTISPYFAYSAFNTTGLPNYYTFVLPAQQRIQQQAEFAAMTQAARGLNAYESRVTLNDQVIGEILDRQLRQRLTTGIGPVVAPATFQDYSHFYSKTPPTR